MSALSECLGWTGERVWVRTNTDPSPFSTGTIVHAFPTPFDSSQIDLAVRLKSGGFTVVMASARGIEWDFESRQGQNQSQPKSA
jgi:hypothetical protein